MCWFCNSFVIKMFTGRYNQHYFCEHNDLQPMHKLSIIRIKWQFFLDRNLSKLREIMSSGKKLETLLLKVTIYRAISFASPLANFTLHLLRPNRIIYLSIKRTFVTQMRSYLLMFNFSKQFSCTTMLITLHALKKNPNILSTQ